MFGFGYLRRRWIKRRPFPQAWDEILQSNVPYSQKISEPLREILKRHIQIFTAEKSFEGCAGLELTDEIRVTIAAHACVLLLGVPSNYYPGLQSILVYPGPYVVPAHQPVGGGIRIEYSRPLQGEAWLQGLAIFSWEDILEKAVDPHSRHNVIYHEFAHLLDMESGAGNGVPLLPRRGMYKDWTRVFSREYKNLQEAKAAGVSEVLDYYGATNPAEFFAVATELFFQRPDELMREHGELYDQLKLFYRQDPMEGRLCAPVRSTAAAPFLPWVFRVKRSERR